MRFFSPFRLIHLSTAADPPERALPAPQETPEVQSLIDGLMRQLLSKEVLHQPMADIAAKYPGWLEAQRAAGALSAAELAKYEEQHACIRQVCALYEAEPIDFDAVVEAMQKVRPA